MISNQINELIVPDSERDALLDQAVRLNSWDMTPRQICDIELLLNGAFSPLSGFLNRSDYESVVTLGQLADGNFGLCRLIWM
jgi:sulfate adenylyltransferase